MPRAAFLRGSQETSLFDLFLGGTANPEGGRQQTDKAEARRAASAQGHSPARRAREKWGRQERKVAMEIRQGGEQYDSEEDGLDVISLSRRISLEFSPRWV